MEGNNMENTKKNEEHNSRLYHEVKLARERLQNITHSFSLEWRSLLAFGMKINDEDKRQEFEDLLVGSQNGMTMLRDLKNKRERKWLYLTQSKQCGIKRKLSSHQYYVEESKIILSQELLHQQILVYYKNRAMGFNIQIHRKHELQVENKNQKEYYRLMEHFRDVSDRAECLKGPGDITTDDVRNFLEDMYNKRVFSMATNNFLERLKLFHISHRYQIRQRMLDIMDSKDPQLLQIDINSNNLDNLNETINNVKAPHYITKPDQLTFEIESLMTKLGQNVNKLKDITGTGLELRLVVTQLFDDEIERCKNISMHQWKNSDIRVKRNEVDNEKIKTTWPFDATRSLLHQMQRKMISRVVEKSCEILSTELSTLRLYDKEFIKDRLQLQISNHLETGTNISNSDPKQDVIDIGSLLQKGKENALYSQATPQVSDSGAKMPRDKLYTFYLLRHLVNQKWRMSIFRILNYFRFLVTKINSSENDTMRRLFTVEIDDEMYVKDQNTNQEHFLEESHRDLQDLEGVMIDTGSFYILKDTNSSSIDRCSVLSDLLECEVSFLRSKLKLVRILECIVQKVPSSYPSYTKLVQALVNVIYTRPLMNMSEGEHYFWESYAWETIQLDLLSSLLSTLIQYIQGDPADQSRVMNRKARKYIDVFQEKILETEAQALFLCSFFELYEENIQALVQAWPKSAYEPAIYLSLQRSINEKLLILWDFVRKEAISLPQYQLERLEARDYFRADFALSPIWMLDCCLGSCDKLKKTSLLKAFCHAVSHLQLQEAFQRQSYRAKVLEKLLALQRDFPNSMVSPNAWANLYLTARDMDTIFAHSAMPDELKLKGSLSQWIQFHLEDEKSMILLSKALELQEAWNHLMKTSLEYNHLICAEKFDFAAIYPFLLKRQSKDYSDLSSKLVRSKHIDRIKDRIGDEFQRHCFSFFLIPEQIKTTYIDQVWKKDMLSYCDKIDALIKHLSEESELQGTLVDLNEIVDGFRIEADFMTNKLNLPCAFSMTKSCSEQKSSVDEWLQTKINNEPEDNNSKRNRKIMNRIYRKEKHEAHTLDEDARYTSKSHSNFNLLTLPSCQEMLSRFRSGGASEENEIKKSKLIEIQHLFHLYAEFQTLFQIVEVKHLICWSSKIDVGCVKSEIHKEISHLHKRWIDVLDMDRINAMISGSNVDSSQRIDGRSVALLQELCQETLLVVKCSVGLLLQYQLIMTDHSHALYQSTNSTDQESKYSLDFDSRSCEALRNLYNSFSNGEELRRWCRSSLPLHVSHSCRLQANDCFIAIEHALCNSLTSEARIQFLERLTEVVSLKLAFLDKYLEDKTKIPVSSPDKAVKRLPRANASLEKLLDERTSIVPYLNSGSISIPDIDCMETQIHTLRDYLEKTMLEEDILRIQCQYDAFLLRKIEITTKQVDTRTHLKIDAKPQQNNGLLNTLRKYLRVDHVEGSNMSDGAYVIPQNEICLFMEDIIAESLNIRDRLGEKKFEDLIKVNKTLSYEINMYEEKIKELKNALEDNLRQEEIKREASVIDRAYRLILAVDQMKNQIITTKEELKIEKAEIHAKLTADYEVRIRDLTTRLLTMSQQFEDYRNKIQHDMRSQVFNVQQQVLRNVIDSGTVPIQTKGNLLRSFQDEVDKDAIIEENHTLKQTLLKLKTLYEVKHASEVATFEKEKAALNVQLERSKANLGDKIILDDRVKKLESELKNLHQEKALYQSKLSFMESNRKSANKTKSDAKVRKLNSTLSDTADISESLKKKLLQQTTNEVELHEKEDEEELKKYEKELCKKSIEAPSMEQQEKFEAKRMSMYLNSTKHLQNEIKRLQQHIQREIKLKNAAMEQVQHLRNQIDQHKEVSIDKMDQSQLNLQYADALKEIAQLKLKLRQRGINDAPYYHLEAPSCPVSPRLQAASVVSTRKYIQAAITAVSNISAHQEVDLRPISTSATGRNAQICNELPRPNTSAVTKDSPRIMALKRFDTKKNEPDLIGVTGVAGPFSPRKPLPYR